MLIPTLLTQRFSDALQLCDFSGSIDNIDVYAEMIRPSGNPKFGDYQSNCAMPIGKLLPDSNPREVAAEILSKLKLDDLCGTAEIAGPGFINLKLSDAFLQQSLMGILDDERCGVAKSDSPKRILVDYSSPNVAKPMHVGHIRTTVIGNCLAKTLAFLGHEVITDNHLGDWGTQFGMIIYGYKHFGDSDVVSKNPVPELAKLYRTVHELISYHKAVDSLPRLASDLEASRHAHEQAVGEIDGLEGKEAKKKRKSAESLKKRVDGIQQSIKSARKIVDAVDGVASLKERADQHVDIAQAVLEETSKLHAGDQENLDLWKQFLPHCKDEINRVYDRLNVTFDHTLGESFYHSMLADVVDDLKQRGLATQSDGAMCVFLDGFDAPMIIQKRDGAYLYATTDLATLRYRQDQFAPDEVLYVVDARQAEHFDKLFAVARKVGLDNAKLVHVSFGTVLGEDGKPIKTRSGTLIGLESLLDDAVEAAYQVVCNPERLVKLSPPMDDAEQRQVADTIGISAIKFADLSHDRTSDYRFSLSKMVALSGNTATYAQYSYARTTGILKRNDVSPNQVIERVRDTGMVLSHPAERALALQLLQFEEALQSVYSSYGPNHLVDYVYSTAEVFSKFNEQCHVLNAESAEIQATRLGLVLLTNRVIRKALELLGIDVVDRM